MNARFSCIGVLPMLFLLSASVSAQEVIFQSNFDSGDGFVVTSGTLEGDESEDTRSEFGYVYSGFDDIPEAPNSGETGGADTTGLKLEANVFEGVANAVAVVTDGLTLPSQYEVQVDAWLNYNFPAGTAGTTEYGGLGLGHDGETLGLHGATFLYDTDGDSSLDYRFYKDLERQELDTGQFAVESLNNTADVFAEAFPPIDLEQAVPEQFLFGETNVGTGGFRWMTISAVVDATAMGEAGDKDLPGIATFTLTDADTGNAVEIGTFDNSHGEVAVDFTGGVSLVFSDIFSSVSNAEELSFGIFDNLIVRSAAAPMDPLDCDGDGMVGASDVACATGATLADTLAAAGLLAGDLNLDGAVDFPDFLILSNNFGDATAGGVYASGDIDLDGAVGFSDFLVLSDNFGATAAAASVPEPSGLCLALVAIGLLAARRRR